MILITRPKLQGEKTKAKLQRLRYRCKLIPLSKINYLIPGRLDNLGNNIIQHDYYIITSQNAAHAILQGDNTRYNTIRLPVFVVGEVSSSILRNAGCKIAGAAPSARDLFELIKINVMESNSFLYFHGSLVAFPMVEKLTELGHHVDAMQVYETKDIESLPLGAMNDVQTVLLYSPHAASIFAKVCKYELDNVTAICISHNAAKEIENMKFAEIKIAKKPNEESMLELI